MYRLVVLAGGGGTNFQAILDAIKHDAFPATVSLVISDRPGAGVLLRASREGIPAMVIDRKEHGTALSDRILHTIPADTDLIVLAGFLSILKGELLERYNGRIINLHPSLLPRHGGAGMYGIHVHRAVINAGDTESGCTVHYVDGGTDTGPVILQRRVPVLSMDTPESLAARIAPVEHEALVAGIRRALGMTADY